MLSALDQELVPNQDDLNLFDEIDDIIHKSVTSGDPTIAFGFGVSLVTSSLVRGGPALAKLLYYLKSNWHLFRSAGFDDDFEDVVHAHMGLEPTTVKKYVHMWEGIFENDKIPTDLKKRLIGRGVKQLLLLTGMAREGADVKELNWVADAPDGAEFRDRIRQYRGLRTSSGTALTLFMYSRDRGGHPAGTVMVSKGRERKELFVLPIDSEDPLVKQAVETIINRCGIREVS